MDAVWRDDITEGKVIVTEKLGEVVKQHQQHSKGTLQGGRERGGGRGGEVQCQAVKDVFDKFNLIYQCLQAILLSFRILHTFSVIFLVFYRKLHIILMYVLNSSSFQYLWSEFSKNIDKSIYLEALIY